jgi:hypothetical protein
MNSFRLLALVVTAGAALIITPKVHAQMSPPPSTATGTQQTSSYVGMWVTADGRIRHKLLPNGRYDEARGTRESAYRGRYEVRGNHIDYWDDTGFTADGTFVDANTLHHGGMVLYRREAP